MSVVLIGSSALLFWRLDYLFRPLMHAKDKQQTSASTPNETLADPAKIQSAELKKLQQMPYDDELYQLTYKTLLFNSHVNDAFNLALIAVAKRPQDLAWHEKLAQTAIWVGDYNLGMKEWLYVAKHSNDLKTIDQAASIAKTLGYDQVNAEILKIYLRHQPGAVIKGIDLATAQNRINQPEQAILTLKKINRIHPTRAAYELAASIYQDTDQQDKALQIWETIEKNYGPSIPDLMAQAEIYYIRKQFQPAFNCLKKGIPIAKKTDTDFWLAVANLAWITGDRSMAILGYSHFTKDKSYLINLVELEETLHPKQALQDSLRGWNQFHQMLFFSKALALAQQLKQWDTLQSLLISLTPKQAQEAQKSITFWEAQANRYAALHDEESQMAVLVQGIKLHPEMAELRVNLLFLLITKGELQWVKILMEDGYEHKMWDNSVSWKVYADAFDLMNKFYAAIIMYQEHLFQNLHYNQFLIDYGHLLEKIKLNQQALNLWHYLWQRTLGQLSHEKSFKKETYQTLSQIAPYFVSGTTQVALLNTLFATELNEQDLVIMLNWMVPKNYFELITYFKAYYFNNVIPSWAGTNLALAHNDLPTLHKSLKNSTKAWSRADLINAAVRLEYIPLALDLAFAELTDRPQAHEIYTEFTQYGIASANYWSAAEEYEQFVNVIGPRTKIDAQFRLTNTWKIQPSLSLWRLKSTDSAAITNVPIHDFISNIKLDQKIHRGSVNYNLGYRKDLNGFIPAAINIDYKLAPKWTGKLKLGYNQENFQNAYMREGGVQDQVNLGFVHNINKYDSLQLEWQGLNYRSQDRHYLADGYILEGLYEHKFWLSYPDYTLGLFGNIYHFNHNGSYGGDITTLFPSLTPDELADPATVASTNEANYQAIIPNSYNEGGFTFSFGNAILDYSRAWRPYLWAALYYNTITAISNDLKVGLSGSVFGADSLIIYAERGTAQATQGQVNYTLGMRYKLYY